MQKDQGEEHRLAESIWPIMKSSVSPYLVLFIWCYYFSTEVISKIDTSQYWMLSDATKYTLTNIFAIWETVHLFKSKNMRIKQNKWTNMSPYIIQKTKNNS